MLDRLQKKWKVSGWRLLLVLVTFAVGGSLTGYAGKKIMNVLGLENALMYGLVYLVVVTLVWPVMVLAVSLVTGQFLFFKNYLAALGQKILRRKQGTASKSRMAAVPPRRIAIFASGAGSNAQNIINYFRNKPLMQVATIVCNKPGAGVVQIAEKEGIPLLLIGREEFFRGHAYVPQLRSLNVDFIVLAGFLWKVPQALIDAYRGRIVNIHPALLPKYGGKGMYGNYVHEAVLAAGETESGITIHFVDEHYDHGDVIFQARCGVLPGDTPELLARRIHELEYQHYPRVIESVLLGSDRGESYRA